jgi:hypothetical protein
MRATGLTARVIAANVIGERRQGRLADRRDRNQVARMSGAISGSFFLRLPHIAPLMRATGLTARVTAANVIGERR